MSLNDACNSYISITNNLHKIGLETLWGTICKTLCWTTQRCKPIHLYIFCEVCGRTENGTYCIKRKSCYQIRYCILLNWRQTKTRLNARDKKAFFEIVTERNMNRLCNNRETVLGVKSHTIRILVNSKNDFCMNYVGNIVHKNVLCNGSTLFGFVGKQGVWNDALHTPSFF